MDSFSEAGEPGGSEPGPPQPTLDLRTTDTDAGVLVRLAGELDVETSARFLDSMDATLTVNEGRDVELDLSRLVFLDVAGVRALISVHDRVISAGGRMRVLGLDDDRLPAAQVLGLGRYLEARSEGGRAKD